MALPCISIHRYSAIPIPCMERCIIVQKAVHFKRQNLRIMRNNPASRISNQITFFLISSLFNRLIWSIDYLMSTDFHIQTFVQSSRPTCFVSLASMSTFNQSGKIILLLTDLKPIIDFGPSAGFSMISISGKLLFLQEKMHYYLGMQTQQEKHMICITEHRFERIFRSSLFRWPRKFLGIFRKIAAYG